MSGLEVAASRSYDGELPFADRDATDLARLGKKQQFRRNFGWLSITGLTCTLMLTWEGSVLSFGPQLLNGGPAGLFGGFLLAWFGTILQVLVMAEMASKVPLSGGQYNWVAAFAPPSCSKFLSYIAGWQTLFTWHAVVAAAVYITASSIQLLATINNPTYTPKNWHTVLIMYAQTGLSLLVNTYLGRLLPVIESNPASVVFGDFIDGGRWGSNGLSFFVGLVSSIFSFLGFEAGVHLAEEVKNASLIVPWSMVTTVIINGSSGFGMLLVMLFVMGDPTTVIEAYASGDLPFVTIFRNALGSSGSVVGLAIVPVLVAVFGCVGMTATSSRVMWALARERALPMSTWLSKISKRSALPLHAVLVTTTIDILLPLIILGSETAYNAFAGMTIEGYFSVYIIVASVGLYQKISGVRDPRRANRGAFSLGVLGIPIIVISIMYSIIGLFFGFWPPVPHPSIEQFNWSIVAWALTFIIALAYWQLQARHRYTGPLMEIPHSLEIPLKN